jgi:thermostable 8-oxoguanine DNA glycosylase
MRKIQDDSVDWQDLIAKAEKDYKFQPELTDKLDNHTGDFSEQTLLEIVLWKTNRYPVINDQLLADINDLRVDYSEEKAKALLRKILQKEMRGYGLPMASTVLCFALPGKFQIIDQRVYRFITQGENELKIPHDIEDQINLYFNYIERLKEECIAKNIPFDKADRVIYQLDKNSNSGIPIKY